jgi:hypothetical protein
MPGDDCKVVLWVIDDGTVTDELLRYKLLIEKLTGYVNYVASDGFRKENPDVEFGDVLVRVLCTRPPNDVMREVQGVGARADNQRRLRVVFDDYEQFMAALRSDNRDGS